MVECILLNIECHKCEIPRSYRITYRVLFSIKLEKGNKNILRTEERGREEKRRLKTEFRAKEIKWDLKVRVKKIIGQQNNGIQSGIVGKWKVKIVWVCGFVWFIGPWCRRGRIQVARSHRHPFSPVTSFYSVSRGSTVLLCCAQLHGTTLYCVCINNTLYSTRKLALSRASAAAIVVISNRCTLFYPLVLLSCAL